MRNILHRFCLAAMLAFVGNCPGQGTAFTYQGRLATETGAANGSYDFKFSLWDDSLAGTMSDSPITNLATPASNGLFLASLDFGAAFDGGDRWLEIAVRTNGAAAFTTLSPRQALMPTPTALFAAGVKASGIQGTIPSQNFASGSITSNLLAPGAAAANLAASGNGALVDPLGTAQAFIGATYTTNIFENTNLLTLTGAGNADFNRTYVWNPVIRAWTNGSVVVALTYLTPWNSLHGVALYAPYASDPPTYYYNTFSDILNGRLDTASGADWQSDFNDPPFPVVKYGVDVVITTNFGAILPNTVAGGRFSGDAAGLTNFNPAAFKNYATVTNPVFYDHLAGTAYVIITNRQFLAGAGVQSNNLGLYMKVSGDTFNSIGFYNPAAHEYAGMNWFPHHNDDEMEMTIDSAGAMALGWAEATVPGVSAAFIQPKRGLQLGIGEHLQSVYLQGWPASGGNGWNGGNTNLGYGVPLRFTAGWTSNGLQRFNTMTWFPRAANTNGETRLTLYDNWDNEKVTPDFRNYDFSNAVPRVEFITGASGRGGMEVYGNLTAKGGVLMATNYVPANFVPVPGMVKFQPSNNWMYAITANSTNAVFQFQP
ncbi:MAG: hypothetical protein U1F65_10590 [Verrucomicrobiota bacterium]